MYISDPRDSRLPSLNRLETIFELFPDTLPDFREKLVACAQDYITSHSDRPGLTSEKPSYIIHDQRDIAVKCFKDFFTPYGFDFGVDRNDRIHKKCKAIMSKKLNMVLNMDFFELFM